MVEIIIWNSLITLSKVGFYLGFAAVVGVQFHRWLIQRQTHTALWEHSQQSVLRIGLFGSAAGLIFVPVWFFASTGAMAEDGITGMLDTFMLEMMWDSAIGETLLLRSAGMGLIFVLLLTLTKTTEVNTKQAFWDVLYIVSLCGLVFSFTLSGHVAELGLFERGLIAAHVLVMAWWIGALLPLKALCRDFDSHELHDIMHRFGQQASVMVSLLILAGGILAYQLTGSIGALVTTDYGQLLSLKLIAVTLILALAAYHKLRLVPSLLSEAQESGAAKLKLSKSIGIEIGIAFLILVITASLTSLVGPTGMN